MTIHVQEQLGLRGVAARGYDMATEEDFREDHISETTKDQRERAVRRVRQAKSGILQVLRDLWMFLVKPIFDGIGYTVRTSKLPNQLI